MSRPRRSPHPRLAPAALGLLCALATVLATAIALGALATPASRAASLTQLNSQLAAEQARQHALGQQVASLSGQIAALSSQIKLVQSREAALRADLTRERAQLARTRSQLNAERRLLAELERRLALGRTILARQLVSAYENAPPDLVSVVIDAHGFTDLLERLDFLHRAESQQQGLIRATEQAKAAADAAKTRLTRLERADAAATQATSTRVKALAGMNALLAAKQAALDRARAAQQAALAASQARGRALQSSIARAEAAQAAAQAAARAAAAQAAAAQPSSAASGSASGATATPTSSGPALGPSGGWAIPYAIVLCESGGQNLTPNSAGASGYYQILPSTWKLFGGSGPAAYLAGKAEQDAVASRIWNGGAGAGNWVCAGIVGIH